MCGIWALFGLCPRGSVHSNDCFSKIGHRGPDAWRIEFDRKMENCYLGFHRLTIVDGLFGMQPMKLHQFPHLTLICNGELYNYRRLKEQYGFNYETNCDVECILHLFAAGGIEHCTRNLDGVFAFVLIDNDKRKAYFARDPFGVRPLFRLATEDGVVAVASEAKGLMGLSSELTSPHTIEPFPPGTFHSYDIAADGRATLKLEKAFYQIGNRPAFRPLVPYESLESGTVLDNVRLLFIAAVRKRLMSDRRIGCLLSGGLDSSLVASLLCRMAKEENLRYRIQSFAIGMSDSPDLVAARQVAEFIGSEHYEIVFTPEEVAEVLDEVIYSLETYDITTVRASIAMYLIARYIKTHTDTTVLFSGEGADEVAQGYIYFRDAPSPADAHLESLRLLKDIYLYDGLRADRTTAAHSLELRVPFLDLQFTQYFLGLSQTERQPLKGVEKHLLRSAFDTSDLLPPSILWRHKEAFSDGVASKKKSLFQIIQDIIEPKISDEELRDASKTYPFCSPKTKESLYYRKMFEKHFPGQTNFTPYFWMPQWSDATDPSARFISHYAAES